jgi:hypothetical protein
MGRGRLALRALAMILALLAGPLAVQAQPTAKVPVVGVLNSGGGPRSITVDTMKQGLRELGYVEGQTITFDVRFSGTNLEALVSPLISFAETSM